MNADSRRTDQRYRVRPGGPGRLIVRLSALWIIAGAMRLAATGPYDAADLVERGDELNSTNNKRAALGMYEEADRLEPNDPLVLCRLSRQYGELGAEAKTREERKALARKALEAAERAVKFGPKISEAHLALAIAAGRAALLEGPHSKIQMSRTIRVEAEAAVRLDPRNAEGWYVLGRWHYEIANLNPFLKALGRTIYGKLGDASNEKAIEYFQKAVALEPRSVRYNVELGRACLAAGEESKARRWLQKGLALPVASEEDDDAKQRARDALAEIKRS